MKAPWFPFYTGDFLASPDVQDMEAHEVGAYVLLLARSWQSDTPGYIEDDEYAMRRAGRLSVDVWGQCKKSLLKKWPLAEDMPGMRFNPRLLKEAERQVEMREKKAEAGLKSAERRAQMAAEKERQAEAAATQAQQSANTNPTPVENPATDDGQNGNYSQPQPQPQPQSTNVDEEKQAASAAPPKPSAKREQAASLKAADYELPKWATEKFAAEFSEWLTYRQGHRSGKLKLPSILRTLNELATYDESFCSQLFTHAIKNGNQGLTYPDTADKFTAYKQARPAAAKPKAMPTDPRDLWGFNGPPATQEPVVGYSTGQYTGNIK